MSQSVRPNIVRDPTPGYRANVAICVADFASGKVLGFQRCDHCSWQFPQGGVDHGETPVEAAFRELYEETGITSDAVELLQELKGWVHYDWPKKRQREKRAMGTTNWKGQRQKWFLMKAKSIVEVECCIDLGGLGGAHQEFGQFAWFHIEDMLPLCRDFKRGAYAHVIREMQPLIAAGHIAESQREGQAARSPVELPTVTVNAAELTNRDQSGVCTLVKPVQESTVAEVVAELVQRHGHQAVQEALDGMGLQGRNKQECSESGEETENVQHSLENDVGLRQASQSSLSLTREDTSQ